MQTNDKLSAYRSTAMNKQKKSMFKRIRHFTKRQFKPREKKQK